MQVHKMAWLKNLIETLHRNIPSLIHTKLAFEIPESYYGQHKSRSGLALKHIIHVQASTTDSDYRGEVKVFLSNESDKTFSVTQEIRIAQFIKNGRTPPKNLSSGH